MNASQPIRHAALCLALALALAAPQALLALGTEFTWQGELRDAGQPANGSYDMQIRLYATRADLSCGRPADQQWHIHRGAQLR